jgi:hypothetical protein
MARESIAKFVERRDAAPRPEDLLRGRDAIDVQTNQINLR